MPFEVTAGNLKKETGEFDLPSIRVLSIVSSGVANEGAAEIARLCPNLTDLDLTGNSIDDGAGLAGLVGLQKLRLTGNKIHALGFLAQMTGLEQVFLQGNRVGHMKEISCMRQLPSLKVLYLRDVDGSDANVVTEHLSYRVSVCRQLPSLTNLDGERTHLEEEHSVIKSVIPEAVLPASEIPGYERWVPEGYWSGVLRPASQLAAPQTAVFESTAKECKKLEESAQSIIDRYNGFANINGKLK